ncbi:MAG: FKBP-type peptidyl-prolyl cis-trans isomerase [Cyclobacteriaceae bacterium]
MKYSFYFLTIALLFVVGCGDDENDSISISSEEQITTYLEANNLVAERSESGLYYIIETEGTGRRPRAASNVTVAYKGYLTDGVVFDQSSRASFSLANVIRGWTEGIQLFREGGKGILLVPAELGYGAAGRGSIPGNAAMVFEVELISVN